MNRKSFVRAAIIFAVWSSFCSSELEAQEVSTKPRFIGVWLLSNTAQYYCSKVLEINMVSDTHANLGFGNSPTTARMELHDLGEDAENIIGVKYELADRDKPLTFYDSFTLVDDNKMRVALLGPEGYYYCDYTKDNPAEAPPK